jgi:hypothetical protein
MSTDRVADIVEIGRLLARCTVGTVLRHNGARDSGRPHDPGRPLPGSARPAELPC